MQLAEPSLCIITCGMGVFTKNTTQLRTVLSQYTSGSECGGMEVCVEAWWNTRAKQNVKRSFMQSKNEARVCVEPEMEKAEFGTRNAPLPHPLPFKPRQFRDQHEKGKLSGHRLRGDVMSSTLPQRWVPTYCLFLLPASL